MLSPVEKKSAENQFSCCEYYPSFSANLPLTVLFYRYLGLCWWHLRPQFYDKRLVFGIFAGGVLVCAEGLGTNLGEEKNENRLW